jgi:hypothetical protein
VAGLLILANPYLVGLPGTGIVNNFAVFIALYIPAAVLTGGLLAEVGELLQSPRRARPLTSSRACRGMRHSSGKSRDFAAILGELLSAWRRWGGVTALVVALILVSGWGLYQRLKDLRPGFALVTEADMEAMAWIRERTPSEAVFLVNGVFMGSGLPIAGADAGWWIPLLAGRRNTVPPPNYMTELAVEPDYWMRVENALLYVERFPPTTPEGVQFLSEIGVTHIYVGQQGGRVGNPGEPLLSSAALAADPAYRLVYERDGVWIFALIAPQGRSGSS